MRIYRGFFLLIVAIPLAASAVTGERNNCLEYYSRVNYPNKSSASKLCLILYFIFIFLIFI